MQRPATVLGAAGTLVAVAALAYWAGTNAVAPPQLPVEEHTLQTYRVEGGTVGRSIELPVTASWSTSRTLYADSDGVVTSVAHQAGDSAKLGEVIASVNLEPLVVAEGEIPMFRTLGRGVEGPDVAQFQEFLRRLDFLEGAADGRFGPLTSTATRRWQRSIAAQDGGSVAPGSLVFIERLPARLEVLAVVGQRISAGSDFVRVLEETPDFVATVSASRRSELTSGMSLSIDTPDGGSWGGELGSFEPVEDGSYSAQVRGTLCGQDCQLVPVGDQTALSGTIELVPKTEGPLVPASALVQQPSGESAVMLVDGTARPVSVIAEADGFAVVQGLEPGTTILLPSPPSE